MTKRQRKVQRYAPILVLLACSIIRVFWASKTSTRSLANLKVHHDNVTDNLDTLSAVSKADKQDETVAQKAVSSNPTNNPESSTSSLCASLGHKSALALWTEHVERIFHSSKHPMDRAYSLHDVTAEVLKIVTPRLQLSQRSLPRDWETLDTVARKVMRKLEYLQDVKSGRQVEGDPPPPIRILVLGGSVTMGVNCNTGIRRYNFKNCAWPNRLEQLINQFVDGKMVVVENMSVGGTNSDTGRILLELDMLPDSARQADIVINAYSTNDMHYNTMQDASHKNVSLREMVFGISQSFARVVLQKCMMQDGTTRRPPLLLWLDDYLGNEQREILTTTELSQTIQVLANYYGFGFVSYGDTVRDLVYSHTRENTFSPAGWYNKNKETMTREIHPGATMHIATSYIFGHYFLHMMTNYCSLKHWNVTEQEKHLKYHSKSLPPGLPLLKYTNSTSGLAAKGIEAPQPRPAGLPPPLHPRLRLDTISQDWQQALPATSECNSQVAENWKRCPFSWVRGIMRNANDDPETSVLEYFEPHWVQPSGWEFKDDTGKNKKGHRKYGFFPKLSRNETAPAVMTLDFRWPDRVIRSMTLFYLKSYGPRWENSSIRVRVQQQESDSEQGLLAELVNMTLKGFHNKQTSETYTEKLSWNATTAQELVRVQLEHEDGQAFKLLGIAMCS